MVLGLEDVLFVDRVPDANLPGLVGRCDVEAARRILGDIDLTRVLSVNVGNGWIGQVPDDDAVGVAVQEVLSLRIVTEHDWTAAFCSGQSWPKRSLIIKVIAQK